MSAEMFAFFGGIIVGIACGFLLFALTVLILYWLSEKDNNEIFND